MRILGIDTATSSASAALLQDGAIIADEIRAQPKLGHAEIVLPLVSSVLAKAATTVAELDGISVSIGPGSFTGLRVGLSTINGLAYRSRLSVVGISTLLANASRPSAFEGVICSMLDARKKDAYVAFFRSASGFLTRLTQDAIAPIDVVIEQAGRLANGDPMLFAGDGADVYRDTLIGALGNGIGFYGGDDYPSLAAAVARLGEPDLRSSEGNFWASLAPVYLRLSQAESKPRQSPN
jgi:tRNA threonylcarbamoyladenosine biosynthesis protein TsaB